MDSPPRSTRAPRHGPCPAETLAYRLRRAVSLASMTPEAPRAAAQRRCADPNRIASLAQPRRIAEPEERPPAVEPPTCPRPPLADLLRVQVETGPQYRAVSASVDRIRVTLTASHDDVLPRSRRRLFVRNQGSGGAARPVVHLTRPRFDERRNSLLRFQERTGIGLILLAFDLRMQLMGSPCLAYGTSSLPKSLLLEMNRRLGRGAGGRDRPSLHQPPTKTATGRRLACSSTRDRYGAAARGGLCSRAGGCRGRCVPGELSALQVICERQSAGD